MPIIVLTTAAGAPGASTTALGLALSWPGPALLVEADPAGTSLVPGWFRGAIDPQERNIVNLALVERAEDLTEAIFDQAVSIAVDDDEHQRLALLGLIEPVQAPALNNWWEPIGTAFQSLSAAGYAVIIDAGRCTQGSFPLPLLAVADQVLLVCRAELSGVLRSYPMATQLTAALTGTGNADAFGVVAIGNGGNRYYSGSAIAKQLGVQFALSLPDDPLSAAALSDGLALPPRLPARIRSRFTRHPVVADEDPGQPVSREGVGGGISAYLTEPQDTSGDVTEDDSSDDATEDNTDRADPVEIPVEVPRTVVVPARLMRAYRAVARDSAHRAEQRLARLLAAEPSQ